MQAATQPFSRGRDSRPDPPQRVLFVITSSDVGGTETFLHELVSRLDPREFEPLVCSLRPCGRVGDDLTSAGIRVLTLGMGDRPRITELVAGAVRLARWIDVFHVDLVQSFLYRANALSGVAARLARRRPIVVAGQRSLSPLGGRRAALAGRLTRRLSDRVVAVSAAVRTRLMESEQLESERIVVIENGVDTARYQSAGPSHTGAQRFGFGPETVLVGGVGRLSPEKGFHHLIEGVALACEHGCPLGLVLAGDGPERPRLETRARELSCNGQVKFLGLRRDPRPVYAGLDVFALPSLEEGSPNALLEAMACGRAVVATRVGGVPEIVAEERSGLLVVPNSARALADSLIRLAADPALRRRLAREAARRARDHFDITRTVERYADLYRELLRTPMRAAAGP